MRGKSNERGTETHFVSNNKFCLEGSSRQFCSFSISSNGFLCILMGEFLSSNNSPVFSIPPTMPDKFRMHCKDARRQETTIRETRSELEDDTKRGTCLKRRLNEARQSLKILLLTIYVSIKLFIHRDTKNVTRGVIPEVNQSARHSTPKREN